jgi:AraC-like DNA-binding protein
LFDIRSDINHINTISDREEHEFFFQSLPRKDIELLYCGYERCKPGHKSGPIMRDHFYYHFIESGSGIFRNNNAEFKVTAGSGFIGIPHEVVYYEADIEDPWTYMWVGAKGTALDSLITENGLSEIMPIIYHKSPGKVINIINSIISCAQNPSAASLISATGLFWLLFSELSGSYGQIPNLGQVTHKFSTQDYLDKAMHFIQTNYSKNISVSTIAEYVGINASYLCRIFKQKYGITPAEFLKDYRIGFSNKLLLHTNMPIKQVAMSVGFNDPQYFSRCFSRKKGLSPREARKNSAGDENI